MAISPAVTRLRVAGLAVLMVTNAAAVGNSQPYSSSGERPSVFGSWDLFEINAMGMTAQVRIAFENNQVISSSTCTFGDKSVHATANSSAEISDSEIRILENRSAKEEYSPGFLECKASVEKGILQYTLSRGQLILQMPGDGRTFELSRTGKIFVSARQLSQ
jgi:hypothetical protein